MAELQDLNIVDSANTGRFPEGQTAASINDGARALEGMIARELRDRSGHIISSGSGSAYVITPFRAVSAHAAGLRFCFRAHVANTGAATIQVDGLAAKPLRRQGGGALSAGDISQNQMVDVIYNAAGDYYEALGVRGGAVSAYLGSFTVAGLPSAGTAGQQAYATNGRRSGETLGNGSGVLVYADGTNWITVDGGAAVEA